MAEQWKSPRKREEEVREYRLKRFEDYMQMVDRGELTRAIACQALREEIQFSEEASTVLRGIASEREDV